MSKQEEKMLPDMPVEERERVLKERIKRRVQIVKMSKDKEHLMTFYEDRSMFYGRLWYVLQKLDEKGKL